MSSTPYMRFYPGDWKQKTQHLEAEVRGVYLEMILHIFANGALPDNDEALARIGGVTVRAFRKMRPMLEPFFIMPGWRQVRAEEEREVARAKSKKAAESANARWREKTYEKLLENLPKTSPNLPHTESAIIVETFEDSVADACERIANAHANAMLSESIVQNHKNPDDDAREGLLSDKEVWEALVAAGVTTEIMGPAMVHDLSPIYRMIHAGLDFRTVIVPSIRVQMARRKSRQAIGSWDFFRPGVIEYARQASDAAASIEAGIAAGPIASAPVRVKFCLPVNWEPAPEDMTFGKNCGLRAEELNSIRDDLRRWASTSKVERDDWADLFRRKAEQKALQLGRKSLAQQAEAAERQADALAKLNEAYNARVKA